MLKQSISFKLKLFKKHYGGHPLQNIVNISMKKHKLFVLLGVFHSMYCTGTWYLAVLPLCLWLFHSYQHVLWGEIMGQQLLIIVSQWRTNIFGIQQIVENKQDCVNRLKKEVGLRTHQKGVLWEKFTASSINFWSNILGLKKKSSRCSLRPTILPCSLYKLD